VSGTRPDLPLLLQAFASFAMTGLIWFVQVVHYPLLRGVGASGYAAYQEPHVRLTTLIVAPLMLLEAATALWLVHDRQGFVSRAQAWTGLGLLGVIRSSTVFLSVPRHEALPRLRRLRPRRARRHELDPHRGLDLALPAHAGRASCRPPLSSRAHCATCWDIPVSEPFHGALLSGRCAAEAVLARHAVKRGPFP
jgi:hypothetical protein